MMRYQVQVIFAACLVIRSSLLLPISGVCPEDHFECSSGSCLPLAAVCDGIDHCGDNMDEAEEICQEVDPSRAAAAAGQYILDQKNANDDWGEFTPRALIALSFLKRLLIIPQEWGKMTQKLNRNLLNLLRQDELPVQLLALYINAQYATCQDPRNFYENDLVGLLRAKTNEAMKSDFNLPIVILTLCLARETRAEDFTQLVAMYDKKDDRIGTKALTIVSMAACRNLAPTDQYRQMEHRVTHFMQKVQIKDNIGIYGKALIYQAHAAWGYETAVLARELLGLQSEDGSFGDLLGTYVAIPALLNTSLADLKCKSHNFEGTRRSATTSVQVFNPHRYIELSLSIPYGQNQGNHSLGLTYQGRKSLHDLMQEAKNRNLLYDFTYDELHGYGKKVNAIAGISNDAETSLSWTLYRGGSDQRTKDGKMIKENGDIDFIYPVDGEHFLFKLEYME